MGSHILDGAVADFHIEDFHIFLDFLVVVLVFRAVDDILAAFLEDVLAVLPLLWIEAEDERRGIGGAVLFIFDDFALVHLHRLDDVGQILVLVEIGVDVVTVGIGVFLFLILVILIGIGGGGGRGARGGGGRRAPAAVVVVGACVVVVAAVVAVVPPW